MLRSLRYVGVRVGLKGGGPNLAISINTAEAGSRLPAWLGRAEEGAAWAWGGDSFAIVSDGVNSAKGSTRRVEMMIPVQFHFATSLGEIDFEPQMLSATLDNAVRHINSAVGPVGSANPSTDPLKYVSGVNAMIALQQPAMGQHIVASRCFPIIFADGAVANDNDGLFQLASACEVGRNDGAAQDDDFGRCFDGGMGRRPVLGFGCMNRRFVLGASLGLALLPFLTGCNGVTHERFEPIRYRLSATVETPEGLRSGYSVIEVAWGMSHMSGPFGGSGYTIKGEAAAVDLPGGQTLFVLLRSADQVDWAAWVINEIPVPEQGQVPPGDRATQIAAQKQRLDLIRANRDIHYLWGGDAPKGRAQYLPYFARFRDIADPKSAEELKSDDLAKSFGKGYALKSLTIQITNEPVTTGIEKRLGWLMRSDLKFVEPYRDPKTGYAAPRPNRVRIHEITGLDFRRPFK